MNHDLGNSSSIGSTLAFRNGKFLHAWRVSTYFISNRSNYTDIQTRNRTKSNIAEYQEVTWKYL